MYFIGLILLMPVMTLVMAKRASATKTRKSTRYQGFIITRSYIIITIKRYCVNVSIHVKLINHTILYSTLLYSTILSHPR